MNQVAGRSVPCSRPQTIFRDVIRLDQPSDQRVNVFGLHSPVFSPDGRWVAYTSTSGPESGDAIVYVQPFPATGAKYRVVTGLQPVWSHDGTELFAVQPAGVVRLRVSTTQGFTLGSPQPPKILGFRVRPNEEREIDFTPDGRILGVVATSSAAQIFDRGSQPKPALQAIVAAVQA